MIRVILPAHLRTLARVDGEVELEVAGQVTRDSVLDALEARYPMLRGSLRDQRTGSLRAFIRFFACEQDLSHSPPDAPLPETVAAGAAPPLIPGATGRGTCAPPSPPARMLSRSTRKSPSRRIGRKPRTTWGLPIWVSGSGCGVLRRRRACAPPSPLFRMLSRSTRRSLPPRLGR